MKTIVAVSLVAAVSLVSGWGPKASEGPPSATTTFDRYFQVVGGRAALDKVQNVVVKATGKEGDTVFDMEISLKPPGLVRLSMKTTEGFAINQGRDAQARCWRQDPGGVRELTSKDSGDLMGLAMAFFPQAQLNMGKMLAQAVCVEEKDGDRTFIAVGSKAEENPLPRLLFDKKTGLLVRISETVLEDYRSVENIRLPFRLRLDGLHNLDVKQIVLNPTLDDKLFEKPASSKGTEFTPQPDAYFTLLSKPGTLEIVRRPQAVNFGRGELKKMPEYNPKSGGHFQVDLRGCDLRKLDLAGRLANLLHADFDSKTQWPADLPAGFDREKIVALGKDPGLGVRELHKQNITGQNIGVGLIDQTLLVDHQEYRDRLRLYEEIHSPKGASAAMHGPAVASILVGKTTGVAPAADLYYIAEMHGTFVPGKQFDWDFTWLAKSIHRLLDVNATLPADKKIRVISISVGWSPQQKGYQEAMAAVERATKDGVFVVSTAIEETHHLKFHGLGREALADPNNAKLMQPGSWWAPMFWAKQFRPQPGERLLVPMDCRTVASPTGPSDYVSYWSGGWSWSVPWIAGLYALACQVDPAMSPERFWAAALKTGETIRCRHAEEEVDFGTIANPVALIKSLQRGT